MLYEVSEVAPRLFLTSGVAVTESAVRERGVTLVVNAAKELPACPLGEGVRVVKVSVEDSPGANLYRHFEVRYEFIFGHTPPQFSARI